MKGCIYHFTKWQIHPSISKVTTKWVSDGGDKLQPIVEGNNFKSIALKNDNIDAYQWKELRANTILFEKYEAHLSNTRIPSAHVYQS